MLLQFKFKNYKSFSEEVTLNMSASNIKEHNESLIEVDDVKILPIAAIFGANASGKSNVFSALAAMSKEVRYDKDANKRVYIVPNIFDTVRKKEPTEFEICLFNKKLNKELRYGLSRTNEKVFEEWLFEKSLNKTSSEKCVFFRVADKIEIKQAAQEEKKEMLFCHSMINDSELLINTLGKRRKSKYSAIYEWFDLATVLDYSDDSRETILNDVWAKTLFKEENTLKKIVELIKEIDPSIIDIRIEETSNDEYSIFSFHLDNEGNTVKSLFSLESSGTKKVFSFTLFLLSSLRAGFPIFFDEFDSKLHPLLLRYIIKIYRNKEINKGGGQLIFSSHNLVCLDSSDLRRDEIWFVEKNKQNSQLYSLYDFKDNESSIRSDLSFGKHYLSGRFGAIPFQKNEDE